ncbi:MAG: aspartate aminotransferase family protein [Neisseriaceae bacterium]|nr:aspartate aminotransferase family protein [Neisseriaceae bacterium]
MNLESFWMPFTNNRAYKKQPRLFASAQGMYYKDETGRPIMDGASGLWCVNAGHGNEKIANAIAEQVRELDFAPCFGIGHPLAFAAADAVAAVAPKGLDRVFFTNSGSESADTALKIALAYHAAKGDGRRCGFIGREKGYHGVNFGGTAVGGMVGNRKAFSQQSLPFVTHLRSTYDLEHNAFSKGLPAYGAHWADELESRVFSLHDPATIAAVIVEPMSGSAGVILPPQGYLQRLRELCTKHGILLIFDEVITGFGRTGGDWASNVFGVIPDMITCAKGLTNGAVPMGAVLVTREIHDSVINAAPERAVEFAHGYTYSAHPLACAAAIATIDVYQNDGLFERAGQMSPHMEARAHALKGLPGVIDIRNVGMVVGVEMAPSAAGVGARGQAVWAECWDQGLFLRVTGDTLALAPAMIISEAEIEEMFRILAKAIEKTA